MTAIFSGRFVGASAFAVALLLGASQVAAAAQAVRHQGSGDLKQTWHIDFDGGVFNTTSAQREDMKFDAVALNERDLAPDGTATIRKMGKTKPSYATCAAAALNSTPVNTYHLPLGTWFCFKTRSDRFVRFRVDAIHSDPGPVTLTYTTWEK